MGKQTPLKILTFYFSGLYLLTKVGYTEFTEAGAEVDN